MIALADTDSADGCSRRCRVEAAVTRVMRARNAAPATGNDAPVGTTKVAVAQRIANRVDGAVDVAQPVTCQPTNYMNN